MTSQQEQTSWLLHLNAYELFQFLIEDVTDLINSNVSGN